MADGLKVKSIIRLVLLAGFWLILPPLFDDFQFMLLLTLGIMLLISMMAFYTDGISRIAKPLLCTLATSKAAIPFSQ